MPVFKTDCSSLQKPKLVFSGHTHFENFDIPKFNNVKQYLMTSINYQNTWHSKESDLNYGPGTPSYYQAKFSHAITTKIHWLLHTAFENNLKSA